jgi:hypothetical protein
LIQEEIRVDLPFRIVSIVFQTGAGAGFRSRLCDGEGRKEGRKEGGSTKCPERLDSVAAAAAASPSVQ